MTALYVMSFFLVFQLAPLGCNLLAVDNDHEGMRPDKLREALSRWSPSDADNPESDIPRVVYTIPNGANPTGYSLSLERRHEIYQVIEYLPFLCPFSLLT